MGAASHDDYGPVRAVESLGVREPAGQRFTQNGLALRVPSLGARLVGKVTGGDECRVAAAGVRAEDEQWLAVRVQRDHDKEASIAAGRQMREWNTLEVAPIDQVGIGAVRGLKLPLLDVEHRR
jgi:hypothetical protein